MKPPNINALAKRIFQVNDKNGWHEEKKTMLQYTLLIQSEMFECFEAWRVDKRVSSNIDDELNQLATIDVWNALPVVLAVFQNRFHRYVKGTIEEELADTAIRIIELFAVKDLNGDDFEDLSCQDLLLDSLERVSFEYLLGFFVESSVEMSMYDDVIDLSKKDLTTDLFLLLNIVTIIARKFNCDLWKHIEIKLRYNATRGYKHGNKKI